MLSVVIQVGEQVASGTCLYSANLNLTAGFSGYAMLVPE